MEGRHLRGWRFLRLLSQCSLQRKALTLSLCSSVSVVHPPPGISHCFLAVILRLLGPSWVVVYAPVLPVPFALVCGIWTLPSGWQVTETCRALQSTKHKVYKALWAARMDLPLVMLLSTGSRGKHYLFLCQGNCVHVCCQSCMCDSAHTGTHRYTSLPCADILAPPLSEKGWHLNLEEGCPARKGTGVGLFQK